MAGIKMPGRASISGEIASPRLQTGQKPDKRIAQVAPMGPGIGDAVAKLGSDLARIGAQKQKEYERALEVEKRRVDFATSQGALSGYKAAYDIEFSNFTSNPKNQLLGSQGTAPHMADWVSNNRATYSGELFNEDQRQAFNLSADKLEDSWRTGATDYQNKQLHEGIKRQEASNWVGVQQNMVTRANSDGGPDVDGAEGDIANSIAVKSVTNSLYASDPVAKKADANALREIFVMQSIAKDPYSIEDLEVFYDGTLPPAFLADAKKKARIEIDRLEREGVQAKKDAAYALGESIKDTLDMVLKTGGGVESAQAQINKYNALAPKNKQNFQKRLDASKKLYPTLMKNAYKPFDQQYAELTRVAKPVSSKNFRLKSDVFDIGHRLLSANQKKFDDDSAGYVAWEANRRFKKAGGDIEGEDAYLQIIEISHNIQKEMGVVEPSVLSKADADKWNVEYEAATDREKLKKIRGLTKYRKFMPQVERDLELPPSIIEIAMMSDSTAEKALSVLDIKEKDILLSPNAKRDIKIDSESMFFEDDAPGGVYLALAQKTGNGEYLEYAGDLSGLNTKFAYMKGSAGEGLKELWAAEVSVIGPLVTGTYPVMIPEERLTGALNEIKRRLPELLSYLKGVFATQWEYDEFVSDLQGERSLFIPNRNKDGFQLFDTVTGKVIVGESLADPIGLTWDEVSFYAEAGKVSEKGIALEEAESRLIEADQATMGGSEEEITFLTEGVEGIAARRRAMIESQRETQ